MNKRIVVSFLVVALFLSSFGRAANALIPGAKIELRSISLSPTNGLPNIPSSLDRKSYSKNEKGLYLVQFTGPVQENWKKQLSDKGAVIGDYIPENSFIVKMTENTRSDLSRLSFVKSIVIYKPAYKVDGKLKDTTGDVGQRGQNGNAYVSLGVTLFEGADTSKLNNLLSLMKTTIKEKRGDKILVYLNREYISQLAANNDVTYIEERPTLALFNEKAATVIGAPTVWSNSLDGTGQVVGIADTGLDTGRNDSSMHLDFQGRINSIFALGNNDPADLHGHGTHVAGSVLGTGARSNGQNKGMAPGAKLVFQSVGSNLSGIPYDLSQLFTQAFNAGARIHSNSWGGYSDGRYDYMARTVDNFVWNNDMTILFAAGNSGQANGTTTYNTISSPGTAKNVITVGASENNRPELGFNSDNVNQVAGFSSRGYTADGRVKPDVVAPGTFILSTKSSKTTGSGYYTTMSGTSMATPITAGAVALVRQYYQDRLNITPKPSLLKATLVNGAVDMGYGYAGRDQGWGRVNLTNSIMPASPRTFRFVNEETALSTGGRQEYSYYVASNNVPLKASLVWTDYPGSTAASKALVNDLDITIISPNGTIYKGNDFTAPYDNSVDRLNNVENIVIASPEAGSYKIIVNAYNVPNGPQKYSMVLSANLDNAPTQPEPSPEPTPEPTPEPPEPTPDPVTDTTAPVVKFSNLTHGAQVSGVIAIKAEASDDVGVTKVEFLLNNVSKLTDAILPYEYQLDTNNLPNGQHQVTARAYDAAGNAASTTITINVNNHTSTGIKSESVEGSLSSTSVPRYKDYYIDVTNTGEINLKLSWPGSADMDLYLYNPSGSLVARSSQLNNPESIKYDSAVKGKYRIRVYAYSGSANYALSMSYPVGDGTAPLPQEGLYTDTRAINSGYSFTYEIPVGASGTLNAEVSWDNTSSDLDVYLYAPDGSLVTRGISSTANPEKISASVKAGTYKIKVSSYRGNANFNLKVNYPK